MGKKVVLAAIAGVAVIGGGGTLIWSLYASVREESQAFERCAAAEKAAGEDFEKALEVYKEFLKAYPDGAHAGEAKKKIEEELPAKIDDREYAKAEAADTGEDLEKAVEAYQAYLAAFPEGRHAAEARIRIESELPGKIDDREYAKVVDLEKQETTDFEKVIAAYKAHLETFPSCTHAEEARARIETELPAKIDEREYAKVVDLEKQETTDFEKVIVAYKAHLETFPSCPHAEEAMAKIETGLPAKIDEREYAATLKRVKEAGDDLKKILAAYNDYLKRFPKGNHAEEVAKLVRILPEKMDREAFQRAQEEEKADLAKGLAAYKKYLAAFPDGRYKAEAAAKVKALSAVLRKKKLDDDAYARAAQVEAGCGNDYEKAIRAYLEYLADHPRGHHAAKVCERINTALPGKILARDYAATRKMVEAQGRRGARAAAACRVFLEAHPKTREAAEIKKLLDTIRSQQGIALPWEFRVTSFKTTPKHTLSVAGKNVTLEAEKGGAIALVGIAFKALRPFNDEEKKVISATRLGGKMDRMSEKLALGDVPYITSRSCTLNYSLEGGGATGPTNAACSAIENPNVSFRSDEMARTIPAGTECATILAFPFLPGKDRTPLLIFTPHPGSRKFFAAKISLDEKGNLDCVDYGTLAEMRE